MNVLLLDRGQAVALVLLRVVLAPDAKKADVEQADGACHHPLAGEASQGEILLERLARRPEPLGELRQPLELLTVALSSEVVVVEVLPAAPGVGADRLDVAAIIRADPNVLPSRRDHERLDALELRLVRDRVAALVAVRESLPTADTPISGPGRV